MKIIDNPTSLTYLWSNKESAFEEMVKIVVDIRKGVLSADGELHSDLESLLLDKGSRQEDLWGANIYPSKGIDNPEFMEFTSFINVRPSQSNKSMEVADPAIRENIRTVVRRLLI